MIQTKNVRSRYEKYLTSAVKEIVLAVASYASFAVLPVANPAAAFLAKGLSAEVNSFVASKACRAVASSDSEAAVAYPGENAATAC